MDVATGKLQWGRNLTVAEGSAYGSASAAAIALQWGRNLTVAEGVDMVLTDPPYMSFNGAAT